LTGSDRADRDAVDIGPVPTCPQYRRQPWRRHLLRASRNRYLFTGAHGGD
jgi:hypothetical protein